MQGLDGGWPEAAKVAKSHLWRHSENPVAIATLAHWNITFLLIINRKTAVFLLNMMLFCSNPARLVVMRLG